METRLLFLLRVENPEPLRRGGVWKTPAQSLKGFLAVRPIAVSFCLTRQLLTV